MPCAHFSTVDGHALPALAIDTAKVPIGQRRHRPRREQPGPVDGAAGPLGGPAAVSWGQWGLRGPGVEGETDDAGLAVFVVDRDIPDEPLDTVVPAVGVPAPNEPTPTPSTPAVNPMPGVYVPIIPVSPVTPVTGGRGRGGGGDY